MQLAFVSSTLPISYTHQTPATRSLSSSILTLPSSLARLQSFRGRISCAASKTGSEGGKIGSPDPVGPDLLRKPLIPPSTVYSVGDGSVKEPRFLSDDEVGGGGRSGGAASFESFGGEREKSVDWEDQILEDTVPLVGFVRMILHSGKYGCGDRLNPVHQKAILERLLPYHPECEKKIGCGVDYITIGYHQEFEDSRCMFIVRKDGTMVDFSYWKCIKGLIRKNYPLYADSFILRHFRRRRRND